MFERFTDDARYVVVVAQEIAREDDAEVIDATHLLLALGRGPSGPAAEALAAVGLTAPVLAEAARRAPGADGLDADALASLGIDLESVRARTDAAFGEGSLSRAGRRRRRGGHIPFTREAKKTLEISLREAIHLGDKHIDAGHMLLAVLRLDDTGAHRVLVSALTTAGSDPAALRAAVTGPRRGRAAS